MPAKFILNKIFISLSFPLEDIIWDHIYLFFVRAIRFLYFKSFGDGIKKSENTQKMVKF